MNIVVTVTGKISDTVVIVVLVKVIVTVLRNSKIDDNHAVKHSSNSNGNDNGGGEGKGQGEGKGEGNCDSSNTCVLQAQIHKACNDNDAI